MKRKILFVICSLFVCPCLFASPGTWIQKANFSGTARCGAVGFSIGNKGYIGTGRRLTSPYYVNDFWEWNQATNVWTQKANFPGGTRQYATGFSIGTKGYIGTGVNGYGSDFWNDFWEWDQNSNTWTQKADFPGLPRQKATGFSIGNKGFIGTGENNLYTFQDFWEWDQNTDTWIQRSNFGPGERSSAVGFSIGSKGYIATGYNYSASQQDLWEWDAFVNTWTQKANFPGTPRQGAIGFSIGAKAYVGSGTDITGNGGGPRQDFWEWDQSSNNWVQKDSVPGGLREVAVGFSIGSKGYVGTGGFIINFSPTYLKDFWEFDPTVETTEVQETANSLSLSVFPNPGNGLINVNFDASEQSEPFLLKVSDVKGQTVYSEKIEKIAYSYNKQINLDTLPKGIYFIELSSGKAHTVKKLVFQ